MSDEEMPDSPQGDPAPPVSATEPAGAAAPPLGARRRTLDFFAGLPPWLTALAGVVALLLLGFGGWSLYVGLGDFLVVLLLSMITAYLLDPIIDRFEASGWNRSVSILICLGIFLAIASLSLLLIVPYVASEISSLTGDFDTYTRRAADRIRDAQTYVAARTGLDVDVGLAELVRRLPALVKDVAPGTLDPVRTVLSKALGSTLGALGRIAQWSLFPVFVFFFLRDFDVGKRWIFELLPHRVRALVREHYVAIDGKIAAFIRGQVLVAGILAVLYSLGLLLFTSIDLAVLIGVLAGVLFVVPYLGTILGLALGTLMAVLKFGVSVEILKVWAVFAVVQGIEGTLLTPKIVGDSVGLHPVAVMVALLVGASLFGVLGMLLAVPVAAGLAVVGRTVLDWYRQTPWFREGSASAPPGPDRR